MPVTLAEAKNNATDDLDVMVIDEFRKESAVLDALTFEDVVNPAGGGATLTYTYRRLITQPTADFRPLNTEYTPNNVTTERYSVDLAVLGGAFEIDRVIARIGPSASGSVALNMQQKIKATKTRFQDEVINGNVADPEADEGTGFDGLDKALSGSDTEFRGDQITDWSDFDTTSGAAQKALDALDEFLSLLDAAPTMILGNKSALARVRACARRAGMYVQNPVDGLLGPNGRPIVRESYGNITFVDPGDKAGSSSPIIPVEDRADSYTVALSGSPTGGTFTLTVDGFTTDPIAYDANATAVQTALRALPTANASTVTVSGTTTKTAVFPGTVRMSGDGAALTGGTTPAVVVTATGDNIGTGLTDLYAVRFGLDGFHGVSTVGGQIVSQFMPDFTTALAVKRGEVEMGPVAVALKATKAAAVFRNIKVR
jgi:hypothetical protein